MDTTWRTLGGLALAIAIGGCQAPRDLDLERRVAEAVAKREQAVPAEAPEDPAESPGEDPTESEKGAPPEANVTERTYGGDEIKAILAKVGGQGPRLLARLTTGAGEIRCELDPDAAPQTVANFVALATGQRPWRDPDTKEVSSRPFYDGLVFHRVIEGFIIQTGNPAVSGSQGPGWTLPREPGVPDGFARPGTLAMVDAGDGSHGSQFFITLKPARHLDGKYTPFGRCGDLGVVDGIAAAPKKVATPGQKATRPEEPVRLDRLVVSWGEGS